MNGTVVHMLVLCDGIVAAMFNTTLTENGAPFVQLVGEVGVTLYTAVTALVVVLVSVAVTELWATPVVPPVKPVPAGAADQL